MIRIITCERSFNRLARGGCYSEHTTRTTGGLQGRHQVAPESTTALFGFRAVAEAVELDVREVLGMVRSGYGDRLAGMVFARQSTRPPRDGWEAFIRSADEITFVVDWDEFLRSGGEIR